MCSSLVILASILSPLRENVNHPTDKNFRTVPHKIIENANKYAIVHWHIFPVILYWLSITPWSRFMSVSYTQAQKQRYRITLNMEVLSDFNPHQIDWEELFKLEGNERVETYIEDLNNPTSW